MALASKLGKIASEVVTPLFKQADEAVAPVVKQADVPVVKQTDELLKKEAVATPSSFNYDALKSKQFTADEYAQAEKEVNEFLTKFHGQDSVDKWKSTGGEEGYVNTLALHIMKKKGIPLREQFQYLPFKPMDETEEVVKKVKSVDPTTIDYNFVKKTSSGNLKDLFSDAGLTDRKKVLSAIKQSRKEAYDFLKLEDGFADKDDIVFGVSQADFRMINGREVRPYNSGDVAQLRSLVERNQKRLDRLRDKYKDTPPVSLYHGTVSDTGIEKIKKEGFYEPQSSYKAHSELDVGAPSFTRDVGLNLKAVSFGAASPEKNIVKFEMPYAEYEFAKINMPITAYKNKDLDVIARSITGDETTIRPINLPRAGFFEKESIIVEAEKVARTNRFKPNIGSEMISKKKEYDLITKEKKDLADKISKTFEQGEPLTKRDAYASYNDFRDLINTTLSMSKFTTTKAGVGHQVYNDLIFSLPDTLKYHARLLAKDMEKFGATEKADNLQNLYKLLTNVQAARRVEGETDAVQELLKLSNKFAEGGFVKKR